MHYSNVFLKENALVFLYVPVLLLLSFGLVVLCIWQYVAFGTNSKPTFTEGDLYYSSSQHIFCQVLNFIEFVWGIQFLRDAGKQLYT